MDERVEQTLENMKEILEANVGNVETAVYTPDRKTFGVKKRFMNDPAISFKGNRIVVSGEGNQYLIDSTPGKHRYFKYLDRGGAISTITVESTDNTSAWGFRFNFPHRE